MFAGKLRIHTCRVILLTSLVWFLIDVVILSFYSECLGSNCKKRNEYDVMLPESLKANEDDWNSNNNIGNEEKEEFVEKRDRIR